MTKLGEAERLLENREAQLPGNLEKARILFREGIEEDAPAAWTGLSETCFWLGEYSCSEKEKEGHFAEGVQAGKEAVKLGANWVDTHLWFAANMGSHGVVRGIMSSLFYLKDLEKHGNLAIEIEEDYFFGAPLRLMGHFYHKCPGWPIGSGDLKKGIQLLERAVEIGPSFILNQFYLAQAYLAKRMKKQAIEIMESALKVQPPEKLETYHGLIRERMEILLDQT